MTDAERLAEIKAHRETWIYPTSDRSDLTFVLDCLAAAEAESERLTAAVDAANRVADEDQWMADKLIKALSAEIGRLREALRWALDGYREASLWPMRLGRLELQNQAYTDEERAQFQAYEALLPPSEARTDAPPSSGGEA